MDSTAESSSPEAVADPSACRTSEPWWSISIKGFFMGCADVVPGVSGGTVALVTGIYDRLVAAVSSVVLGLLTMLKGQFREGIAKVDLGLILPLIFGVGFAIASMAKVITACMTHIPELTWGLFLGLMIGSVIIVGRMVKNRRPHLYCLTICSGMLSYLITISSPVETAATPMNFFLSGAVAIVAMILPGISGSFLLLIMGKYMQVIGAIKGVVSSAKLLLSSVFSSSGEQMNEAITQLTELGFGIVLPFVCGCALGLGAFSWLLSYLLKHYRDMMMSILLGLMIGTLHKLWPIRVVTAYLHRPDKPDKVLQDQAVMPYLNDPMHLGAMVMIVVGLFFVLMVEKKAAK